MPETILKNLIEKYSTCNSYSDSGRVEGSIQAGEWAPEFSGSTFSHQFIRPGYIKAKYRSLDNGNNLDHIILADGDTVRLFRSINGELIYTRLEEDIARATSSYTGVSNGQLPFMLGLLIPDQLPDSRMDLTRLVAVEQRNDEEIRGSDCFHLSGILNEMVTDIWIDKSEGSMVKSERILIESDEIRKERIELMTLMHRESGGEQELLEESFSANLTVRIIYYFDKVAFNESMTIESLLDLTE